MEGWIHSLEVSKNVSAKCVRLLSHAKWSRASQASQAGIFGDWEYPGGMCILVCKYVGLFFGGGEWKSDYSCLAFLFVMVCFHQKRNLKQVFWQDVVSVRCCEVHQALHVIGAWVLAVFLSLKGEISVLQIGSRCCVPQPNALSDARAEWQPQYGPVLMLCGVNAKYPPMSFFPDCWEIDAVLSLRVVSENRNLASKFSPFNRAGSFACCCSVSLVIHVSQRRAPVEVGRDLWQSSGPSPCSRRAT